MCIKCDVYYWIVFDLLKLIITSVYPSGDGIGKLIQLLRFSCWRLLVHRIEMGREEIPLKRSLRIRNYFK